MWWMIWPGNPALSIVLWIVVSIPVLYAARRPMHGLIKSIARTASSGLRLGARWLVSTAEELRARNKVVLLAHGSDELVQSIDREFERVSTIVQRDLHAYPALQRKLTDEITRIEEDFKKCGEVPPPPPEWTKAIAIIAKIKSSGDGLVEKILQDIADSVEKIYDRVTAEYRRSYQERHKILAGFQPFWRSLNTTLNQVNKNLNILQESAKTIDGHMDKYEQINKRTDKAEHALTSSASTQFAIAAGVLVVAFGGAFVNFFLIARPMSAMVGGGQYIVGDLEASHVAAMVIILMEATAGLFLIESLRITHLFPRINSMPEKRRYLIMWSALTILVILACVEVALAVMRDLIITADMELKRGLGNSAAVEALDLGWVGKIPVAGQMVLGFILPFALAFVAIPLEYFIYSARTVLGVGLVLLLRGLAIVLRLLGNVINRFGSVLVMMYDVVIFVPLLGERMVDAMRGVKTGGRETRRGVAAFPGHDAMRKTGG